MRLRVVAGMALSTALASLLIPTPSAQSPTTFYVRAGSSGARTGMDWTSAYPDLPSALIRGATYYIAAGTYARATFDDATSGTQLITLKKATAPDHGTDVGWQPAFGTGPAIWPGWTITSSHYRFNGVTGGGPGSSVAEWPGSWQNDLGFVVRGSIDGMGNGGIKSGLTFEHIEVDGGVTSAGGPRAFDLWGLADFTVRYAYVHNWGEDFFRLANGTRNLLIEHSKFARNYQSSGAHGDLLESQGAGGPYTFRWSICEDCVGSYWFGSHSGTVAPYYIYGNIFDGRTKALEATNGIVANLSGGGSLPDVAYCNNSLAGQWGIYNMGIANMGGGTVAGVARSNIWDRRSGTSSLRIAISQSANTIRNQSLAGVEVISVDPFSNYSAYDFRLAAASTPGESTGCPAGNSVDMFGRQRGTDGVWDRGALEFVSGQVPPPMAPTLLRLLE